MQLFSVGCGVLGFYSSSLHLSSITVLRLWKTNYAARPRRKFNKTFQYVPASLPLFPFCMKCNPLPFFVFCGVLSNSATEQPTLQQFRISEVDEVRCISTSTLDSRRDAAVSRIQYCTARGNNVSAPGSLQSQSYDQQNRERSS